ncbi:MAG: lysine 5,6-aminomutase subunit alpha [Candidatus Izimaplasma sp.]|nr:lysine 5,6-aminomutase subunit alpha [Candidatus Izimaplasma bacterium]
MKLTLKEPVITASRTKAKSIANQIQLFIDKHSTVSVERTILRLLGVDGVNSIDIPYPNVIIDDLKNKECLKDGVAFYLASALKATNLSLDELVEKIDKNSIDITSYPKLDKSTIREVLQPYFSNSLKQITNQKNKRDSYKKQFGDKQGPLLYVIVATGNIYEDVTQAKAAARQGADVIAVIRTTGQSLLDFVPYGPTTEGFGGTYATQQNFKIMREALDQVSEEEERYIHLVNYASGLCMPEIAAMGALERLDMMLNDSLYGILFRDINMKRTFIDQYFSRIISAYANITINTGEDNYLTTADAFENAHTVLASQFINEAFAKNAFMKEELQGLGHAFEIDPSMENGFLYELAQAQLARQIFPKAPLKYMPPTKHMTGNIFKGFIQNALFNIVTKTTNQRIHLLGMLTEAVHTPFMSDRYLAIENANYINQTMKDFASEIEFKKNGKINKRANTVLSRADELLTQIEQKTMFKSLSEGVFADIKRQENAGKGLEGVFVKSENYLNPVLDVMKEKLKRTW